MATMDASNNPSFLQFFAWKLGKAMDATATKAREKRAHTFLQFTVRLMLHIAGFAGLTVAAFTWSIVAGWAVAGICCLILSALITTPTNPPDSNPTMR